MKKVLRIKQVQLTRNQLFAIGFIFGLVLTICMPDFWEITQQECPQSATEQFSPIKIGATNDDFEPRLNLVNKPMAAKKTAKNIIRPRYYSSELGIREKLFVGVMTTQENIETLSTAFNRTTAHLVNKIKFFINAADNVKSNFKLKNIVGFTDSREHLKPFHVLKYLADNYLDEFDFFLLTSDSSYVNINQLLDKLYHISISFDTYMGTPVRRDDMSRNADGDADRIMDHDRDYCDLASGIVLSSSVIRKIRSNLDWCVRNAATNFHSVNIGRCVKYSSKIDACQQSFQGIEVSSFKLNTYKLYRDLHFLTADGKFNIASVVYPVKSAEDLYILHTYFSKLYLEANKAQSIELDENARHISDSTISNDILEIRWPLGVPPSSYPDTRHDIIVWTNLNETHQFMPDAENNIKQLSDIDREDFKRLLNRTIINARNIYPKLTYDGLHTAYKRFDPVRGMDYQLHLNFLDKTRNVKLLKSFEAIKPLGRVEIIPSPYVTESIRIALLLPTFEHQIPETLEFINRYEKTCMEHQDNTFLMLVLLYRANSPNKNKEDVFAEPKRVALKISDKYKVDGSRIAWVSIRLTEKFSAMDPSESSVMLRSMYGNNEILSLLATDLALRKIGLESLVMICSSSMTFRTDFLNRVRMNTIQGFQIYSPIGFVHYPCNLANFCKECDTCDVSQGGGYFDKENSDVISFYSRDYVKARKTLEQQIPIVRSDNDIDSILDRADKSVNNILDLFIRSSSDIHILRSIEPSLRFGLAIKNAIERTKSIPHCEHWGTGQEWKCLRLASRKQIGDAIIRYQDSVAVVAEH